MRFKKIIILFLFIIIAFMMANKVDAVIFGNREIILNISNVKNIENVEIYTLYPIDYIDYKYSKFLNNKDLMQYHEDKNEILNNMKEALENKEYLDLIKLDQFNVFDISFDEKYILYRNKVYLKGNILPQYIDKENFKSIMLYSRKEYDENTIAIPFFVDYNYDKLDFKYLLVEGEKEKILSIQEYKYDKEDERGVTDYSLVVEKDYNKIDVVNYKEEFSYEDFEEIGRTYTLDDNGEIISYEYLDDNNQEVEIYDLTEEEKNISDILYDNLDIICIVFSIINLILIVILIRKIKNKNK